MKADCIMRSEEWQHERRKQERAYALAPMLSEYNPGMPWESVIRSAAELEVFWVKQFEKPASRAESKQELQAPAFRAGGLMISTALRTSIASSVNRHMGAVRAEAKEARTRRARARVLAWRRTAGGKMAATLTRSTARRFAMLGLEMQMAAKPRAPHAGHIFANGAGEITGLGIARINLRRALAEPLSR